MEGTGRRYLFLVTLFELDLFLFNLQRQENMMGTDLKAAIGSFVNTLHMLSST